MRLIAPSLVAAGLLLGSLPFSANAQPPPSPEGVWATPVRSVLGLVPLPTVVEEPRHFRLLRVSLPAGQASSYPGAQGFVYVLSGNLSLGVDGDTRALRSGDATYVGTGQRATLRSSEREPAVLLHFLMPRAADIGGTVASEPATVAELYRGVAPIPSLKPGSYEFTLTKVTFPVRMPPNPPHYRSGAALYYVLSGTGTMVVDGKAESKPAGTPVFEPYGLVHQWGNPSDRPLVILQMNISPEGAPVVIMGSPPTESR